MDDKKKQESLAALLNAQNLARLDYEDVVAKTQVAQQNLDKVNEKLDLANKAYDTVRQNTATGQESLNAINKQVADATSLRDSLASESKAFEDGKPAREETERQRVQDMIAKEAASSSANLQSLKDELSNQTALLEAAKKEVQDLKDQADVLHAKNKDLSDTHDNDIRSFADVGSKLAASKDEYASLLASIASSKDEFSKNTETLATLSTQNDSLRKQIDDNTKAAADLDTSIVAKKAEFDAASSRLFAIADKEKELQQKELYIKEKYVRAGVAY